MNQKLLPFLLLFVVVLACDNAVQRSSAEQYQRAILDVDGLFYTEIRVPQESQVNRVWIDPQAALACEEIVVDGEHLATTLYSGEEKQDISPGREETHEEPISSSLSSPFLTVLPYLEELATRDYHRTQTNSTVILEAEIPMNNTDQIVNSKVTLDANTLFPIEQRLTAADESEVRKPFEMLYENVRTINGKLDPNSRGTCQMR